MCTGRRDITNNVENGDKHLSIDQTYDQSFYCVNNRFYVCVHEHCFFVAPAVGVVVLLFKTSKKRKGASVKNLFFFSMMHVFTFLLI